MCFQGTDSLNHSPVPSPLYGNMDTIRAAQQQQQAQLQLQHTRQLQHLQQQQQAPPSPFGGMAPLPIPRGFPVSASFVPPGSFPSISFAPPPFATTAASAAAAAQGGQGGQQPFGANGPPTLQFEEREDKEGNDDGENDEEDELSTQVTHFSLGFLVVMVSI